MKKTVSQLPCSRNAFYIFDIPRLRQRVCELRRALPPQVSVCYAVKANPFITRELICSVDRFEVCSPGEAEICRQLKVPAEQTVISGVYKTPEVMEQLVSDPTFTGVFTVESEAQWNLLSALSEKYNRRLPLLLRLTNGSQFGMDAALIDTLISRRAEHPLLELRGIQFFSGTQKTSLKKLCREIRELDAYLLHLQQDLQYTAAELEYGPGLPAVYFEDDTLDEPALLEGFSQALAAMQNAPAIVLELGRSIAACCGRYYTHVVDVKQNAGQAYLLTDGGMHHLSYFGQSMAMRRPHLSVVGREAHPPEQVYHICGSLCSMNDIIVKQVPLPHMHIGDTLVFENTGAYSMTEGIALFLSRDLPAVFLLLEDGAVEVRPPFETATLNLPQYPTY